MKDNKLKILLFDIESSPLTVMTWGVYEQNALHVIDDWHMLSFAYKWYGDKTTHVKALPDYKTYKKNKRNDKELVEDLWELFNEADIIIGHNGDKFDIKKSNARFIAHDLLPPPPNKTIDTLKLARKYFNFTSNKLDAVGVHLGVGRKESTGGFGLWLGCLDGDMKAWAKMKRYNKQDVVLLEAVYNKLRPWMHNHPTMIERPRIDDEDPHCLLCNSTKLQKRGWGRNAVTKYRRYQCECGKWSPGQLIRV